MPNALQVWFYRWLACADLPSHADLIFCLAGRENRKRFALEMFRRGQASQILLSVARFEIRRFDNLKLPYQLNLRERAAAAAPERRHFFVHLSGEKAEAEQISYGRLGTLKEIRALKEWLADRSAVQSVIIISSAPHLRRVRLCCSHLLPASVQFRLLAADPSSADDFPGRNDESLAMLLAEAFKVLVYWIILHFFPADRGRNGRGELERGSAWFHAHFQ